MTLATCRCKKLPLSTKKEEKHQLFISELYILIPLIFYIDLFQDLELYGVDYDCNEPVCDNPDIMVHPQLNPDLITDIRSIADRNFESPF